MTFAIVIPSYRPSPWLARCLASVSAHAPAHTEIVVVDDASTAASVSVWVAHYPRVRCVRLARRSGFCVAANTGLRAVAADVVELLNDDAEVTAGWSAAPLERLREPLVASVAPLVLLGPPHLGVPRIDSAGDDYDVGGFASKRGHGQRLSARWLQAQPVVGASGSSAFYRRSAVLALGGFAEAFGAYFEDVDLALRLRTAGYAAWYEPTSVVWHRGSASYGRTSRRLLEQQSRNEEWLYWRHAHLHHLPRHLAVLAGKALLRWREGTLVPWSLGRVRAWLGK
jgi:hypothetical protein